MEHPTLYGGIEAGGTKMVCAVGSGPNDLRAELRFPTAAPADAIAQIIAFFREQQAIAPLAAIGIGSFGPVDLHEGSPTWGFVTTTPKPGWANADFAGPIGRALGLPVGFDTDVNVAALGEGRWGAAQGLHTFLYLTIGTGIGGGGFVGGQPIHGLVHPELGHMLVRHDWQADPYGGNCPYHGDCFEGLACGPALEARWGARAETFGPDHAAWPLEAHYIAQAMVNCVTILSPQRIILGGGVMANDLLFSLIHRRVQELLNGYVQSPDITTDAIASYIVPPGLGARSGVLGAIALAEQTYRAMSDER